MPHALAPDQPEIPGKALELDLGNRRIFHAGAPPTCDQAGFAALNEIEDASRMVRQIERDGNGVPILLKQYLKHAARLLGFSADVKFSDALDGLIMADLPAAPLRTRAIAPFDYLPGPRSTSDAASLPVSMKEVAPRANGRERIWPICLRSMSFAGDLIITEYIGGLP
jgi:hypothetical protein